MKSIPWGLASLVFASALLVAGCGGGGRHDNDLVNGSDVPLSATTSSAGALAFIKRVVASSDESSEPLRVGDAVLATSDTDDPDPGI